MGISQSTASSDSDYGSDHDYESDYDYESDQKYFDEYDLFENLDPLSADDLRGYFMLWIDIPGPYRRSEIHFLDDKNCTFQETNIDYVSPPIPGTYQLTDNMNLTINFRFEGEDIKMQLKLKKAKKSRVFADHTLPVEADPDEEKTGTEIKNGSQILVINEDHDKGISIMVPWRILHREDSFFKGVIPGEQPDEVVESIY